MRRFEFVPLWGIKVFLVYAPRRVDCRACGVRVERLPWASGKHRLTDAYAWFLARWARRLSWKEVAEVFASSWDSVFRSVEMAVEWGRAHADYAGVRAIGIDEIAWQRGHKYLTLVYQIDAHCKRLLWVGNKRKVKTLLKFSAGSGPNAVASSDSALAMARTAAFSLVRPFPNPYFRCNLLSLITSDAQRCIAEVLPIFVVIWRPTQPRHRGLFVLAQKRGSPVLRNLRKLS